MSITLRRLFKVMDDKHNIIQHTAKKIDITDDYIKISYGNFNDIKSQKNISKKMELEIRDGYYLQWFEQADMVDNIERYSNFSTAIIKYNNMSVNSFKCCSEKRLMEVKNGHVKTVDKQIYSIL